MKGPGFSKLLTSRFVPHRDNPTFPSTFAQLSQESLLLTPQKVCQPPTLLTRTNLRAFSVHAANPFVFPLVLGWMYLNPSLIPPQTAKSPMTGLAYSIQIHRQAQSHRPLVVFRVGKVGIRRKG